MRDDLTEMQGSSACPTVPPIILVILLLLSPIIPVAGDDLTEMQGGGARPPVPFLCCHGNEVTPGDPAV